MPDLATFQLAFATAMCGTRTRGTLEGQPGFAVYRNTTPVALAETLRANYPVVGELLGDALFVETAFAFARHHPASDPVLLGYGPAFPAFLAAQPWIADLPYLPDVAAIERLRTEAHMAADASALGLADLAGLGTEHWPALRLRPHPATRIAWLQTPALTIWRAHHETPGFETLSPEWRAEGVLVTRPSGILEVHALDAPMHRMIFGLRLGETAGEAAAATASTYPEADIASAFAALVNAGALARPASLERN
ncbi:MAG TPA: DNA-binding domain-containing protein [Allosphingosinicella sp.]|nr:DNA-binding domain-containing protein [Allosphingosinicella sp.]